MRLRIQNGKERRIGKIIVQGNPTQLKSVQDFNRVYRSSRKLVTDDFWKNERDQDR